MQLAELEHERQYRAGLIPELESEIHQAQLLVQKLMGERRAGSGPKSGWISTSQNNEYGRIVTDLAQTSKKFISQIESSL